MVLHVNSINLAFGPNTVLSDVSFSVAANDRAGIVGANGSGKTSLFRILTGELTADSGSVQLLTQPGYLPQHPQITQSDTVQTLIDRAIAEIRGIEARLRVLEEVMATAEDEARDTAMAEYGDLLDQFERRGGYDLDHRTAIILDGLRITYLDRHQLVETLSGGERTRVLLAGLLLSAPDLLLLDEPTNHLDFFTIEWLERYLDAYTGAMVIVSHDRRFLDRTVTRILEIDDTTHTMKEYRGNYSFFQSEKVRERARWEEDFARQQEEVRALNAVIKVTGRQVAHNRPATDNDKFASHFFGGRVENTVARNVRNARERLSRIQEHPVPKPPTLLRIQPTFDSIALRSTVMFGVDHVSHAYDGRNVLNDLSFVIGPRDRIVIVGPNGTGKTTLLNLLAGRIAPQTGSVSRAPGLRIGYLDQEGADLTPGRTVLEEYRSRAEGQGDEVLNQLFRYGLLAFDDVYKRVEQLSVGQRRKLLIAEIIAANTNLLLLDEPTNHLALDVVEQFEHAIDTFPGPVIAVSHDRIFIERFRGTLWELKDGLIHNHEDRKDEALQAMTV